MTQGEQPLLRRTLEAATDVMVLRRSNRPTPYPARTQSAYTLAEFVVALALLGVLTNRLFIFYNDPSLSTNGPISGFSATSWREL